MATIKYTAITSGIKGSIAGTTFQGGRVAPVIRTKPIGPPGATYKITKADAGRALDGIQATSEISSSWKNLTAAQQNSWRTQAPNYPATNKWGDLYTPTGFQLYMTMNTRFAIFGLDLLTDAPTPGVVVNAPDFSVAYSSGAGSLDVAAFTIVPGYQYVLYGARSLSKGRNPQKSDFKLLYAFEGTETFPFSLGNFWSDNFGPIPSHANLWFRLDVFNKATAQRGVSTFYQLIY